MIAPGVELGSVAGEGGGGVVFFPSVQHMTVDGSGNATVDKFGISVGRAP